MRSSQVLHRRSVRAQLITTVALTAAALGSGGRAADARLPSGAGDPVSLVPDDNRGFQFDVADLDPKTGRAQTFAVTCGFYDRGVTGAEKRVIVYSEAPAKTLFGVPVSGRWSALATCTLPARVASHDRGDSSITAARAPRVVVQPPVSLPLARGTPGRRNHRVVLIVGWTRRADGRWAQLERYSVLRQQTGVMYQFGDFRIDCCLNAASAYVTRIAAPGEASTRSPPADRAASARR